MKLLRPDFPSIGEYVISDSEVVIAVTREELVLLANSLNEALEAVEEWEFDTRLGGSSAEALALGSKVNELLHETRRPE